MFSRPALKDDEKENQLDCSDNAKMGNKTKSMRIPCKAGVYKLDPTSKNRERVIQMPEPEMAELRQTDEGQFQCRYKICAAREKEDVKNRSLPAGRTHSGKKRKMDFEDRYGSWKLGSWSACLSLVSK